LATTVEFTLTSVCGT